MVWLRGLGKPGRATHRPRASGDTEMVLMEDLGLPWARIEVLKAEGVIA
jgi:hypothetical protein